jgi:hypothetical protein
VEVVNMKKMAEGGVADNLGYVTEGNRMTKITDDPEYYNQRKRGLSNIETANRKEGRRIGNERQEEAQLRSAPKALVNRGVDYLKDKALDVDAKVSEKIGLDRRAAAKRGMRQGLKDEGYKAGGMVGSASKRADGCAIKGKTRGKLV